MMRAVDLYIGLDMKELFDKGKSHAANARRHVVSPQRLALDKAAIACASRFMAGSMKCWT